MARRDSSKFLRHPTQALQSHINRSTGRRSNVVVADLNCCCLILLRNASIEGLPIAWMNESLSISTHVHERRHGSVVAEEVVLGRFLLQSDESNAVQGREHVSTGVEQGQLTARHSPIG